jgi:hypothetical protein
MHPLAALDTNIKIKYVSKKNKEERRKKPVFLLLLKNCSSGKS